MKDLERDAVTQKTNWSHCSPEQMLLSNMEGGTSSVWHSRYYCT